MAAPLTFSLFLCLIRICSKSSFVSHFFVFKATSSAYKMDTQMAHVAPVTPGRSLPTITIQRMLKMTTASRRFKIELVITGVRNSSLTGEPIPHKSEWQQHFNIVSLGQDRNGDEITVEATNDDTAWLNRMSKQLTMGRTVIIEQPTFSGSK